MRVKRNKKRYGESECSQGVGIGVAGSGSAY